MDTARQSRSTETPLPSTEGTLPPRESAVEAAVIVRPHGGATVAADRSFPIILAGDTKEGVAAAWWRDGIAAIRAEEASRPRAGGRSGPSAGAVAPWLFREFGGLYVSACLTPAWWVLPNNCTGRQHLGDTALERTVYTRQHVYRRAAPCLPSIRR